MFDTSSNKVSDSYLPELPTSFGESFFTILRSGTLIFVAGIGIN
jgi:hypothetical protein